MIHLPYVHAPLYMPIFPLFNGVKEKKKSSKGYRCKVALKYSQDDSPDSGETGLIRE